MPIRREKRLGRSFRSSLLAVCTMADFPSVTVALPQHGWRLCRRKSRKAWRKTSESYTRSGCCCAARYRRHPHRIGELHAKGLGVGARPDAANVEACVLLTLPAAAVDPAAWMRPLAEEGIVDLASFQENQFQEPTPEEDSDSPWPDFIARIEVQVSWQDGPDPVGAVHAVLCPGPHPAFSSLASPGTQ